jgi:signal-transduction protein with cAMP-binding, CBS, and nucleotidyltransferase domain
VGEIDGPEPQVPTVAELMSRDLVAIDKSESLVAAARRMTERRVGSVLVFDHEDLTGILTERDILRAVAKGVVGEEDVGAWMTPHPETVEAADTGEHAAVLMLHGGFRHLPVTEGERVVGIISMRDLLATSVGERAPRGV